MNKKKLIKAVRKRYPFAVASENFRPGAEGWDIRVIKDGQPLAYACPTEEEAWERAYRKIQERERSR